jgi:hypothetical protein
MAGVGLLLLAAAGLKLAGANVAPFAQYGWLLTSSVQTVAVGWELLLGGWLLSGKAPRTAWILAGGTFLIFSCVSGYLGLIGQASCGCFGIIKASPWFAFALDLLVLVLLAAFRPRGLVEWKPEWRWAIGVVVVLATTAGFSQLALGSVEAAVAKLRGQTLSTPSYLDFGTGSGGELKPGIVTVRNWTDNPLRIIGGTADCSCIATADLPVTVPPNGSAELRVTLKVPAGTHGQLIKRIEFLTDCPKHPRLRLAAGVQVE